MKKIFIGFMLLVLVGCTGLNANQVVTTASDVGLAMVLKNNPQYKAPTVVALNEIKALLAGSITYDSLLIELAKYAAPEYAYIILILKADLSTDTPVSTSVLPMLDSYKAGIIKRIDNYILIASI
jgi:hypothetical protein